MKSILIIHPEGNSFNNPTLKAFIDYCLLQNVSLDIWGVRCKAATLQIKGICWITYNELWLKIKGLFNRKLSSRRLTGILVIIESIFLLKKYDLIIGIDREGLIDAYLLSLLTGAPYAFFSFEIMFKSETSRRFKALEIDASRNVCLWLVQDQNRADCLVKENALDMSKVFICPVASAGAPCKAKQRLRDLLGIPKNKRVAIIIGSIARWTSSREVLISVTNWPADWVLIIHERYGQSKKKKIISDVLKGEPGNFDNRVYLSDYYVDAVDGMEVVLAGVEVGISFYTPDYLSRMTGKNLAILGRSSGKIATYVRHGVPVIMNDIGMYVSDNQQYKFGVVVKSTNEIPKVLNENDYCAMRKRASRYYFDVLDSTKNVSILFQQLLQCSYN